MRGAREESRYDYVVGFVFRNGVVVLAACAAAFGCSLSSGYTSDPSTAETTNDVNKGTSEAGPGGGGGGGGSGGGGGGGGVSDGGAGLEGNPDAGNVTMEVRVNGVVTSADVPNGIAVTDPNRPLLFGGSMDGAALDRFMFGAFAEIVVVQGTVSDQSLVELETNLRAKYALP